MQIEFGRCVAFDLAQKVQELLGPMLLSNPPHELTGHDVEGGVQACRIRALVVVCAPLDLAGAQLQYWLGASSTWIWVFSSTESIMVLSGGSRYSPITSITFAANNGSLLILKVFRRWSLRSDASGSAGLAKS